MPPDPTSRLVYLGDVPPRSGVKLTPAQLRVAAWIGSRGRHAGLWVHGPSGSGKTTAVAAAIRTWDSTSFFVKRIACFQGMCFEEVLQQAADLLQQAGSGLLAEVLRQRTMAQAKVAVLLEELRKTQVILWIDDFDLLLPGIGGLEGFLKRVAALAGGSGRIILTSEHPPPPELLCSMECVAVDWENSPFASRWGFTGGGDIRAAFSSALGNTLRHLSESAISVLYAASALPPEPSRQALREVLASLQVELVLRCPEDDPPLLELESQGLVTLAAPKGGLDPASGPPLSVPALVRELMAKELRSSAPSAWATLQVAIGTYFVRLGSKSKELWHLVNGWRAFFTAKEYDAAYELQKTFVEELLQRGSTDLARLVLEETTRTSTGLRRAVALGNLAIIRKNCGDLSGALKLYEQVREEFESLDDSANLARVLHQIGNTQYVMGNYETATESYESSLEISNALGDLKVAAATQIQVANVHYMQGDRTRALAVYLEALDNPRVSEDHGLSAAVNLQIGQIHLLEKHYLEADLYLKEAERRVRPADDRRGLVKILQAQAILARERREYDRARVIYDQATEAARALGDHVEAATNLVLTGELEEERLHFTEALRCYLQAQDSIGGTVPGAPEPIEVVRRIEDRLTSLRANLGPQGATKAEASARAKQAQNTAPPPSSLGGKS